MYITTSIIYPNANPHIGHALELVQADFLARYYRLHGQEVFFQTGLDEHGLKLQRAAEKEGSTPQQFVDAKSEVYRNLSAVLQISHDRFIRTSDPEHATMAQALWKACQADIYKASYRAWYNVKEEEFLGRADEVSDPSVFGIDPQFIELIDEENYFFRLSRYKEQIVDVLKKGEYKILPEGRMNEILNFIEQKGLQDVSISREASKLPWGVPVPGDSSQVMYVWFDALANYLTFSCDIDGQGIRPKKGLWPADLHCIGKDIIRFHAVIWTGMLLSAGLPLPKQLLVHGHLLSGGEKMSKSLGNVVDPIEAASRHGSDALRWFLLKEVPTTGDADFTIERLSQVYLSDLANDLGNLVSRVWSMSQKYSDGLIPRPTRGSQLEQLVTEVWQRYHQAMEARQLHEALQAAHSLVVACNKSIEEGKPWQLAKEADRRAELDELLYNLLESIRHVFLLTSPVLVGNTQPARNVFPEVKLRYWESFAEGSAWGVLQEGMRLGERQPILFPKPESGA